MSVSQTVSDVDIGKHIKHTSGMVDKAIERPEDELYPALGKRIQTARKRAGLTQDAVAAQVGLTRTSVTNIESGRQKIQIHTLYAIAEAVAVQPWALLPPPGGGQANHLELELPKEMPPQEREWVQRVLTSRIGGRAHEMDKG